MLNWLSTNLVNIALIIGLLLITGLLIRGMIRDKKAGRHSCGGNCSACGVCGGCSACSRNCAAKNIAPPGTTGNGLIPAAPNRPRPPSSN